MACLLSKEELIEYIERLTQSWELMPDDALYCKECNDIYSLRELGHTRICYCDHWE